MIERADEHRTDISSLTHRCKTLNQLKQIHGNLLKLPFRNFSALTSLLSFAVASTDPAFFCYAEAIFRNLRRRTTFLYNTMIRGYVQSNKPIEAILCYKGMLNDRLIRNNYTFTPLLGFSLDPFIASALIEFYALNLDMVTAEELFGEIPVRDVVLWTTMVDGYGKIGDVEKARAVFDEMPERNVISWSTIMAAYSRKSDFREVLCLYRTMEDLGLKPNEAVLFKSYTSTALVDMYSKCGCMNLALTVFDQIHDKDSRAWNAIISGLALNGDAKKSLELFDNMVLSGTQPTEATFVAVLTACTHAKLLDKGLSLFENMVKIYKIEVKIEHYACMVDLLARSGKLEEAEKFIDEKMGGIDEGDANVWGALLGACRVYGKVEIGNRLWRKLAKKGVADYGIHVLAYNMFREAGWDAEAKSVRRLIQKKQMKKKPGCSAIEVNGIVEEFVAGDVLHPQADDMYRILYFYYVMYHVQ
ncbi:putative pentatricopeptide repeat-containing protein, chloroplastic [Sesamum angolense]|uniref:Pentatricopeptide repeat-containing protein, chloroplastic n=1 Tax=Sesamum angolense TaxID=2727404 RepID=A0AAE1WPC4_9LAMI|nr:putative pentatricopeptide repeat-containing protein, chloroplastic [Sesamum angolense]